MRDWIVPQALKDWLRLIQLRHKHPDAQHIWSPRVHRSARLATGSSIAEDVVVNANVSVGRWTYVNKGAILFSGSIGAFCSIAHYAQIGPEDHPLNHLSTSPMLYRGWNEFPSPPRIGNDVWVGSHAVVLQGVTVGDGAVIAAGSIVTKDVRPYAIVGGVPAKMIRTRFDDETVSRLLALRWWDVSDLEVHSLYGRAFQAGAGFREHLPFPSCISH